MPDNFKIKLYFHISLCQLTLIITILQIMKLRNKVTQHISGRARIWAQRHFGSKQKAEVIKNRPEGFRKVCLKRHPLNRDDG